jgi:nitroreductase
MSHFSPCPTPVPMTDPLHCLDVRRSTPLRQLGEPGPDQEQLLRMLRSALRVPDHGRLTPWRLLQIRGSARARLGELLVERQHARDPDAGEAVLEKDRQRFSHAPLVVAVISRIEDGGRIPEQEQLLSAGCVCFALLQAAQALGFGAQWVTGWPAYDRPIADRLGLEACERVVGFIHIGTPRGETPERLRPDPAALLSEWTG